jgi:hypothetical protein
VPPRRLIERGNSDEAVHAGFGRHQPEGVLTGQREGHALEPGLFARLIVEQLALEAAALGPLQVHAQQHLGPVLRLSAAGAGMNRDDRVRRVVLATEHLLGFRRVNLRLERIERHFEIRGDVFPALRPFDQDADVVDLLGQAVA